MLAQMDVSVIWDDEPGGNVEHVAQHGLTPDEVDGVLLDDSIPTAHSASTGRPCKFASPGHRLSQPAALELQGIKVKEVQK